MALSKKLDLFLNENFKQMSLKDTVGDRFMRYSKYIIQERAIPDIRDGLKPVQRRILFAMNELGITSTSTYKKSAKICGEVMGKYHPHGDFSIYEAMVRLSQDWKMGCALIDMHGNNGSIDGDSPAAMRYTEARLAALSDYLLQDIDKNTVNFIPNFDEEESEPLVLPSKFPNLLVNGSQGISSGYATNIPPHNFNEVLNATISLIDNPNLTLDELLKIMPGPDFPTGGIIEDTDGIKEAFLTGQGKITIRSKYHFEDINREQKRIVITEIPFDVTKALIVEKIEDYRIQGILPDLLEVRDESDREGLRIAIDLKSGANENAILNYLFKNTQLQIRYSYNMVSIYKERPVTLGVIPILKAYIEHQKEIIINRTNYLLDKAEKRLHIVLGLIKMVSILDLIIKTIRESQNKQDSKDNLVKKFDFTMLQAEAIVTMQLYRLSNTDILALENEKVKLNDDINVYQKILASEKELLKVIKVELSDLNSKIKIRRRSLISDQVSDLNVVESDLISSEDCYVTVTRNGYLKRLNEKHYNLSKNNYVASDDSVLKNLKTNTLNTLLMFTNLGNYIYLPVYKIPEVKVKDLGEFINSLVQIDPKEKIISAYSFSSLDLDLNLLFVTNLGNLKQHKLSIFKASRYSKAMKAMKLSHNEVVVSVSVTENPLEIFLVSKYGQGLRFRASEVGVRDTLNTGGVKGLNLLNKDYVIAGFFTNLVEDVIIALDNNKFRRFKVSDFTLSKRTRATSDIVKLIKSNPTYIVAASNMSSSQYRENVEVNIVCKNHNYTILASEFKYGFPNSGKALIDNISSEILYLDLMPSSTNDIIDSSYLEDEKVNLFNANKNNILDDLDSILNNKQEYTFFTLEDKHEE